MNYRKTLLSASIISSLCLSGAVFAQNSVQASDAATQQTASERAKAAQQKDATNLVGVTVVGIRASLQKSLVSWR